jgi:hypothetical protein
MCDPQQAKEFFAMMKESEVNAHLWHLQTESYARHLALQGYYDNVIDLIDKFIEVYQGSTKKRVMTPQSISFVPLNEHEDYFDNLCMSVNKFIDYLNEEQDALSLALQDITLDIKSLIDKTKYLFSLS